VDNSIRPLSHYGAGSQFDEVATVSHVVPSFFFTIGWHGSEQPRKRLERVVGRLSPPPPQFDSTGRIQQARSPEQQVGRVWRTGGGGGGGLRMVVGRENKQYLYASRNYAKGVNVTRRQEDMGVEDLGEITDGQEGQGRGYGGFPFHRLLFLSCKQIRSLTRACISATPHCSFKPPFCYTTLCCFSDGTSE
jgi:hypothetical protein